MCLLSTTINYFVKEKQNKFQALFMEGNLRSNNALYKTPKHSLKHCRGTSPNTTLTHAKCYILINTHKQTTKIILK